MGQLIWRVMLGACTAWTGTHAACMVVAVCCKGTLCRASSSSSSRRLINSRPQRRETQPKTSTVHLEWCGCFASIVSAHAVSCAAHFLEGSWEYLSSPVSHLNRREAKGLNVAELSIPSGAYLTVPLTAWLLFIQPPSATRSKHSSTFGLERKGRSKLSVLYC